MLHLHAGPPLENEGGPRARVSCRGTAGFAHVSCLAEQAKILVAEAEENNLSDKVFNGRWVRVAHVQPVRARDHHGVVRARSGGRAGRTYLGRPETDTSRRFAMTALGNGLSDVQTPRGRVIRARGRVVFAAATWRISELTILVECRAILQARMRHWDGPEEALEMKRDVYLGRLMLNGEEHLRTIGAANNYGRPLLQAALRRSQVAAAQNDARGATRSRRE